MRVIDSFLVFLLACSPAVLEACARIQPPVVVTTTTAVPDDDTTVSVSTTTVVDESTTTTLGVCTGCPVDVPSQLPPDDANCFGSADNPSQSFIYTACATPTDNWENVITSGECISRCIDGSSTFLVDGDLIYYVTTKCVSGQLMYSIVNTAADPGDDYNPVPAGYKIFCATVQ